MGTLALLPRETRLLAAAAAAGLTLLTLAAAARFGPLALLLPVVAGAVAYLLTRPGLSVAVFVGAIIVFEPTESGPFAWMAQAYTDLPAGVIPIDFLLLLATASVALDLLRRREGPRLPLVLGVPLGVIVLAGASGAITGTAHGASLKDIYFASHGLQYLLLTPVLVATVVRTTQDARRALMVLAAAGIGKSVIGLASVVAGIGEEVAGSVITYYEPLSNWLALLAMLGAVGLLITRTSPPPRLFLLLAPFAVASLLLSQRRSFWLAAVFGLTVVVLIGASRFGRRVIIPGVALLATSLWILAGSAGQLEGPLAERAESLKPSAVQANAQDRYRLDERANVVAELRRRPLTGLGLAVEWSASERALPIENENGRKYVHMAVLWHWLKLGILGLVGLLLLYAAGLRLGWRVWKQVRDPFLRVGGLVGIGGVAGLIIVEATGTFTGVEERMSTLLGVICGLLAAILAIASRPPDAEPTG